jgi:hypothetical protein
MSGLRCDCRWRLLMDWTIPVPALAISRPPLAPGSKVPMQYIGRARSLRRKIVAAHAEWTLAGGTLLKPFRPAES